MKTAFTKDEIQKMVMMGLAAVALLYTYHSFLLGPLQRGNAAALRATAELSQQLAAAEPELKKVARMEEMAAVDQARFTQIEAEIPPGAALAWLPPKTRTFFESQGVQVTTIRPVNSFIPRAPELAEFVLQDWVVEIPQTDFATVGKAIAALENDQPLAAIKTLKLVAATSGDPEFQSGALTFSRLLRRDAPGVAP